MINKKENIIKTFVNNGGNVLDNNCEGMSDYKTKGLAIVEFVSPGRDLGILKDIRSKRSNGQTISDVYVDDENQVHISMSAPHGIFYNYFNIDKAIDNYNQNVTTEGKKIKRLYFPDGSTLEAQI